MSIVKVCEFTTLPGPRYKHEGPHSGEEFRTAMLEPAFVEARKQNRKLTVDLDGVKWGYPTSFLEESFGGLAREYGISEVQDTLDFVSQDEPLLIRQVQKYIADAQTSTKSR